MTLIAGNKAEARKSDPATSHQAAASLSSESVRRSQLAVFKTLKKLRKGGTDQDIAALYDRSEVGALVPQSPSGLRTRRRELADLGLIKDSGRRKKLVSGRHAIVWEVSK